MANDISQIGVVAKNEIIKCVRGRKFLVSVVIVFLVFMLITGLQFVIDSWDKLDSMGELTEAYLSTFPMVIVLVVALLSSIALVSEFEERTALILFTRPVRRTSILVGKILACTIIEALILLVYYIMVTAVGLLKIDDLSPDLLTSFGFAVMYAFAASGVAFVISAFFKKSSVCTVISILLMLVIFPIVSTMVESNDGENWYMIDQAGETIYTCIPEYVERYNETLDQIGNVVDSAVAILKGFTDEGLANGITWLAGNIFSAEYFLADEATQKAVLTALTSGDPAAIMQYIQYINPDFLMIQDASTQASILQMFMFLTMGADGNLNGMIMVLEIMGSMSALQPMDPPDLTKEFLVLLVWGIAGYFIAWIRFVRREF